MLEQPTFGQQYGFLFQAGFICLTLVGLGWRAQAYVQKIITNHLQHIKEDIIASADAGHREIVVALRESGQNTVAAISNSAQTIILALKP